MADISIPPLLPRWLLVLTLLLPALALGQDSVPAGHVVHVSGEAYRETADGRRLALRTGDPVHAGDTLVTAAGGRLQVRTQDGGMLALRSASRLRIDAYTFQSGREKDRSWFSLLKGGLRSLSGLIGKDDEEAYRVDTPVATIGIRGTLYDALLCRDDDCPPDPEPVPDGLYAGVSFGRVMLRNPAGELLLGPNAFGYVADAETPPRSIASPPGALLVGGTSGSAEEPAEAGGMTVTATALPAGSQVFQPSQATTLDGRPVDLEGGTSGGLPDPRPVYAVEALAHAVGPAAGAELAPEGDLIAFDGVFPEPNGAATARYGLGSARAVDFGTDPATGVSWGRWAEPPGGGAELAVTPEGQPAGRVPLAGRSLHWVAIPGLDATPGLPLAGQAHYLLVGNTPPTDGLGNTGFLGQADLRADFTAQAVDLSLSLGIADRVWDAAGQGLPLDGQARFSGPLDVSVRDPAQAPVAGAGTAQGFLGGPSVDGVPLGAGAAYSLGATLDGAPATVSGTAAFRLEGAAPAGTGGP
jgi:hypothetical protein